MSVTTIYPSEDFGGYWNHPTDVDRVGGAATGNMWNPGYGPSENVQGSYSGVEANSSISGKLARFQQLQQQIRGTVSRLGNMNSAPQGGGGGGREDVVPTSGTPAPVSSAPPRSYGNLTGFSGGRYSVGDYYSDPASMDTQRYLAWSLNDKKAELADILRRYGPNPDNWDAQRKISELSRDIMEEDSRQAGWDATFARNKAAIEEDRKRRLEQEAYAATKPNYYVTPDGKMSSAGFYETPADGRPSRAMYGTEDSSYPVPDPTSNMGARSFGNIGMMPGPSNNDIAADKEAARLASIYGVKNNKFDVNTPSAEQIEAMAEAFGNGQLAPDQIPKRGATLQTLYPAVLRKWPKFDFEKASANYKYTTNSNILRAAGLAEAALPRVYDIYDKISNLKNTFGIPLLDEPWNKAKKLMGNTNVTDFESLRNAIIQEVNTALSGSSTASDYRIKLELENLKSGMTVGQQVKSIDNLISALEARKDATAYTVYPLEVVQGKMSMGQWQTKQRQEAESVKSMKFANAGLSGGDGTGGESSPPPSSLKEGMNTTFGNGQVWTLSNGQPKRVK